MKFLTNLQKRSLDFYNEIEYFPQGWLLSSHRANKPLEEIFRAGVFRMLKDEGKITDEIIEKLMKWRHSEFNIDNGLRIKRDDEKGRESVAQYILRNPFSVEKMTYNDESGTVIYQSK